MTKKETAEYIRAVLIDLNAMAAKEGFGTLSYLLSLARLEAENRVHNQPL